MQGKVAGKEADESQDKYGRNISQIRLVRWQQPAEWRRTGFAETFGQRRLDIKECGLSRRQSNTRGHTVHTFRRYISAQRCLDINDYGIRRRQSNSIGILL